MSKLQQWAAHFSRKHFGGHHLGMSVTYHMPTPVPCATGSSHLSFLNSGSGVHSPTSSWPQLAAAGRWPKGRTHAEHVLNTNVCLKHEPQTSHSTRRMSLSKVSVHSQKSPLTCGGSVKQLPRTLGLPLVHEVQRLYSPGTECQLLND